MPTAILYGVLSEATPSLKPLMPCPCPFEGVSGAATRTDDAPESERRTEDEDVLLLLLLLLLPVPIFNHFLSTDSMAWRVEGKRR